MKKIIIPDFGSGNYASIVRMVEKVGGTAEIVATARPVTSDEMIIMAGVGAFDNGMEHLHNSGWHQYLEDAVIERNIPVLGICLGMQMMCLSSEEGKRDGLGWIQATVRHFNFSDDSTLKVPHMGWNNLNIIKKNLIFPSIEGEQRFYFTHSYYVDCLSSSDVIANCDYGHPFVASFQKGNIFGVQFHPEKSHRFGLSLISKFVHQVDNNVKK